MKSALAILSLALAVSGLGNDALDLLDSEVDQAQNVFEHAARVSASSKGAIVPKKFPKAEPKFPMRWATELPPKFPFDAGRSTKVAPRGLFEYQDQDRALGRGGKLSRARIGVALETFYGVEILADALFASSGDSQGWETLRASIPLNDQVRFSAGKFPPPFSTEYSRDAAVRWFPTLSPFASQIAPASSLGAMLEGRSAALDWKLGWFSGDSDHRWHLDYLYNMDGVGSESIPMGYRHLVSAGTEFSSGRLDFYTEFLLARSSQNTEYGITTAARYWLLQDAVSFVGRYQYARSQNPGRIVSGWGIPSTGAAAIHPAEFPVETIASTLSSFYGGINIHLDDDNFIIGTGLEYRSLSEVVDDDDFSSWGWNTFARYAF
jgi:hypothetical protein